jgi:hypothetical protein
MPSTLIAHDCKVVVSSTTACEVPVHMDLFMSRAGAEAQPRLGHNDPVMCLVLLPDPYAKAVVY